MYLLYIVWILAKQFEIFMLKIFSGSGKKLICSQAPLVTAL